LHKKRHSSRFGAEGPKSPVFCEINKESRVNCGVLSGALPPPFTNIKSLKPQKRQFCNGKR
jgi:hypothetical protein